MKQLVLLGGTLHCLPILKKQLDEQRFARVIAADSGLDWAYKLGIEPDYMLGDFDSAAAETLQYYKQKGTPMKAFPTRKDYTDSELAVWAALDETVPGDEVWIVGGIGSRMDHTMANLSLLYAALKQGVQARLLDGLNEIVLIEGESDTWWEKRPRQKYISLIPFLGDAEGIDLQGFVYPLQNAVLHLGECRGISNEICEKAGRLHLKKGYLLVIRSADDTRRDEFSAEK